MSAASEASDLSRLEAAAERARIEVEINLELWKMTGFDLKQRPPRQLWVDALWLEAELAALEGRRLRLPPDRDLWFYGDREGLESCGVQWTK